MRILLFGKNGQVGWELQRSLAPLGELVAIGRDGPAPPAADFRRPDDLSRIVRTVAPLVIVNAAAYTSVDEAEFCPELARTINSTAPAQLARLAAETNAWLVHYSTDQVFDGSGERAWNESSTTSPLNVYGQSKLEGEEAIRRSGCKHLIFRTSWVHSARGDNFVRKILRLAVTHDRLKVVADQHGAPTGAELLADVTAHALRGTLVRPELGGTYHVAAAGETTWHAYASFILDFARHLGVELKLCPNGIEPVPGHAYPQAARRPRNSRLDTSKLRHSFDLVLPHWQIGVERMLKEALA